MDKTYEIKSGELNALPVEELFGKGKYIAPYDLFIDLLLEYGRKLALEDYIKAVDEKTYLSVKDVKGILGMIGEDEDE